MEDKFQNKLANLGICECWMLNMRGCPQQEWLQPQWCPQIVTVQISFVFAHFSCQDYSYSDVLIWINPTVHSTPSCPYNPEQAEKQLADYQSVKEFILSWVEKAESLLSGSVVWSPISQLQEQIRSYQVSLDYFYWMPLQRYYIL